MSEKRVTRNPDGTCTLTLSQEVSVDGASTRFIQMRTSLCIGDYIKARAFAARTGVSPSDKQAMDEMLAIGMALQLSGLTEGEFNSIPFKDLELLSTVGGEVLDTEETDPKA